MARRSLLALLCGATCCAAAPPAERLWMNRQLSVDARVELLLEQMTNEEKQAQTVHLTGGNWTEIEAQYGSTSFGAFPAGGDGSPESIVQQNARQSYMVNNSRLGIPVTFHYETLHSGGGGATIFPMPCLQGSTWDHTLVGEVGRIIGLEASANGGDRGFSPEINVCTDPRFGRTEENFGEDPALVSAMGVAAVQGLHGGNVDGPSGYLPKGTIVSEAKHAAAYGFGGKDGMAADLSPRTLHDIYLRPWREYKEAGGRGAMLSHNSINDVPAHADPELMSLLRRWAPTGGVNSSGMLLASDMCDVGLLASGSPSDHLTRGPTTGFGVAANLSAAGAMSMEAGMDQELCNPTDGRGQAFTLIAQAVKDGLMSQAALDRATANVLRAKFAVGLFDVPFPDPSATKIINGIAHKDVARRVVAEGAVLLQNNQGQTQRGLPLRGLSSSSVIAIIGPLADDAESQCGGYTNFGANVTTVMGAAKTHLPTGAKILSAKGAEVTGNSTAGFGEALEVAAQADATVVVVGDTGAKGWDMNTCGENDDRTQVRYYCIPYSCTGTQSCRMLAVSLSSCLLDAA
jgi:beta-glucosidase|eukprot:COSAG02_NODE_2005_length_10124_cov_15.739386_1_plen_573_part_00